MNEITEGLNEKGAVSRKPKGSLSRFDLAVGQTLYRLMRNRLGTLRLQNPDPEGMTDLSTWSLMPQDMIQVSGVHRAIWGLKKVMRN